MNERMLVNAAIEKVIAVADDDGSSARIVIEYGSKLKQAGLLQVERTKISGPSGGGISGVSPGYGKVDFNQGDTDNSESVESNFGIEKDRVGYYRLWKEKDGLLKFHHFWKSDLSTEGSDGEKPNEYWLGYCPITLDPKFFGVVQTRWVFSIALGATYKVGGNYLHQIYGRCPRGMQGLAIGVIGN